MDRQIDQELQALKSQIVAMGGYVERAIEEVSLALNDRQLHRLDLVSKFESEINKSHMMVDEGCLNLLARQSPLASDLRLILAIIKINTDLERMGDQAMNISHNTRHYLRTPPLKIEFDLSKMTAEVQGMVKDSLDAFMKKDLALANKVLDNDDVVDEYKDEIFQEVLELIRTHPDKAEQAVDLMLIARNLERLGDHATNIAEDVIFVETGRDIRHGVGR